MYQPDPKTLARLREQGSQAPLVGEALADNPDKVDIATRKVPITDPVELEKNRNLWQRFGDKMKADPNFRQAVLQTGLGMMRTPQNGESWTDIASNALGSGVSTLDMLRQRDKAQKEADANTTFEHDIKSRQTKTGEDQVGVSRTNAATQQAQVGEQVKSGDFQRAQYPVEADLAERRVAADEKRATADLERAQSYAKVRANHTPADIQKINIRSAELQRLGMDPVQADNAALEYLQETGKAKSPADAIRFGIGQRMTAYNNTMEGFQHPPTPEMIADWAQQELALQSQINNAMKEPNPFEAPKLDSAKVKEYIARQKALGASDDKIAEVLIGKGVHPSEYGLVITQPAVKRPGT